MSPIHIQRIDRTDRAGRSQVVATLVAAFQNDPVSRWLFPDPHHHLGLFEAYTQLALDTGHVYATGDHAAAALWTTVEPAPRPTPPDHAHRFQTACGDDYPRFVELDQRMTAAHPHAVRHDYLAFVGVDPTRRHQGLGGALIRHHLDHLDATGTPSYLDASSEASRDLYERLGYHPLPDPIHLPDGPTMWPMWREPNAA